MYSKSVLKVLLNKSARTKDCFNFNFSQDCNSESHVKVLCPTYIMPHLLTVAGLAFLKESTSNTSLAPGDMISLSPFANVSVLLSSRTLFKFSIHTASTGPSNIIQIFSPFLFKVLRHIALNIPSVQSFVLESNLPNIW
eukprot:NODE_73_length_23464_cov_0.600171.p8 type:complete len:139 gc:universal NODE_73_length_23464_cov_0.600171:16478-16894(+)